MGPFRDHSEARSEFCISRECFLIHVKEASASAVKMDVVTRIRTTERFNLQQKNRMVGSLVAVVFGIGGAIAAEGFGTGGGVADVRGGKGGGVAAVF